MIHPLTLLKGAGLGAGIMYFFDPISGNRRRALVRDQLVHAGIKGENAAEVVYRDAGNRFSGLVAETRSLFSSDHPSGDVLAARVKSRIGRCTSHPAAIEVKAHDGTVTLQGPVLTNEVDNLLANVKAVRGVNQIDNQLEVHDEPGHLSALQGGPRRGTTPRGSLSPTAQAALILGGAGLFASLLNKRDLAVLAFSAVGLTFMAKEMADRECLRSGGQHTSQMNRQRHNGRNQSQHQPSTTKLPEASVPTEKQVVYDL